MSLIKYSYIVLFGAFLWSAVYSDDREITASYITNVPKIDGKLDEYIWKSGVWFTDFKLISDPDKLAGVQTEFQIAYDDENVYIGARMREPDPGHLKIEEFRRDGAICHDDSFELMIDPFGDRHEYFHFSTNAVGVQYDAKQSCGGQFHDRRWNANWKVATSIGSNEWTLEMAIPYSELCLDTKRMGVWNFNVARQRWVGNKRELSSFSPMQGSFHIPQKFSRLYLPEVRLNKFFWEIKGPFDYHIESDKGDWVLAGKVNIKNDGSDNEKYKLLFKQVRQKGAIIGQVLVGELPIGVEREHGFRLPIERQDPLELLIELVNIDNPKEVYRAKRAMLDVEYKSMELQLLNPPYRNSIYANENISELKMMVRLVLVPKMTAGSKLQIHLLRKRTASIVSECEISKLSNVQEVSLPINDLVPGRYIVEAQIVDNKGEVIAKVSEVLRKLRHEEHEWRLDGSGVLLHNGVPFLPKGWFGMLPNELHLPYNALFMSTEEIGSEVETMEYLDSALKANAYAAIYPYTKKELESSKKNIGKPLAADEIKGIQERIKNFKKHPALMAWIIASQPEFDEILPERIRQIYAIITEEDPFHPAVIVNSTIGGIAQFMGMADITMIATTIPFAKREGATRPINMLSHYLELANKMDKKSAFWSGLQANDYSNTWNQLAGMPVFMELRNMVYQAIIGGVKGYFWQDYRYLYNFFEAKVGVDYLVRELDLLKDAILAPEEKGKILLQCADRNIIYISHKVVGKDSYLFLVNAGKMGQRVRIEIPSFEGIDKLYVLSEDRVIEVKDRAFSDDLAPYATHIYLTKEVKINGELGSLREVQEAIDDKNKAKKKVGDLAFADSGVKIVVSSCSDANLISKVNDGVLEGLSWASKKGEALPQWVELSWPKPIRAEKVIIYSDTIEHARVQIKRGEDWVDISDFTRRSGAHLRAIFEERELEEMRILITEKKLGASVVTLAEVEVYNSSTHEERQ